MSENFNIQLSILLMKSAKLVLVIRRYGLMFSWKAQIRKRSISRLHGSGFVTAATITNWSIFATLVRSTCTASSTVRLKELRRGSTATIRQSSLDRFRLRPQRVWRDLRQQQILVQVRVRSWHDNCSFICITGCSATINSCHERKDCSVMLFSHDQQLSPFALIINAVLWLSTLSDSDTCTTLTLCTSESWNRKRTLLQIICSHCLQICLYTGLEFCGAFVSSGTGPVTWRWSECLLDGRCTHYGRCARVVNREAIVACGMYAVATKDNFSGIDSDDVFHQYVGAYYYGLFLLMGEALSMKTLEDQMFAIFTTVLGALSMAVIVGNVALVVDILFFFGKWYRVPKEKRIAVRSHELHVSPIRSLDRVLDHFGLSLMGILVIFSQSLHTIYEQRFLYISDGPSLSKCSLSSTALHE